MLLIKNHPLSTLRNLPEIKTLFQLNDHTDADGLYGNREMTKVESENLRMSPLLEPPQASHQILL